MKNPAGATLADSGLPPILSELYVNPTFPEPLVRVFATSLDEDRELEEALRSYDSQKGLGNRSALTGFLAMT